MSVFIHLDYFLPSSEAVRVFRKYIGDAMLILKVSKYDAVKQFEINAANVAIIKFYQ